MPFGYFPQDSVASVLAVVVVVFVVVVVVAAVVVDDDDVHLLFPLHLLLFFFSFFYARCDAEIKVSPTAENFELVTVPSSKLLLTQVLTLGQTIALHAFPTTRNFSFLIFA